MSPVHASAVVVGRHGLLIRGRSGSGKSTLAAALLDHMAGKDRFSALIADDGVVLSAVNGRLIARAPASISGKIELRGLGIITRPSLSAGVIDLVVDIVDNAPRLPDAADMFATIEAISLPRLAVPRGETSRNLLLILTRLALVGAGDGEYLLKSGPVW